MQITRIRDMHSLSKIKNKLRRSELYRREKALRNKEKWRERMKKRKEADSLEETVGSRLFVVEAVVVSSSFLSRSLSRFRRHWRALESQTLLQCKKMTQRCTCMPHNLHTADTTQQHVQFTTQYTKEAVEALI